MNEKIKALQEEIATITIDTRDAVALMLLAEKQRDNLINAIKRHKKYLHTEEKDYTSYDARLWSNIKE